jgi:hypothetical protein
MRYAMAALGAALGLAALLASCGGADICLGCDGNTPVNPENQVTAQGNVFQIQNSAALVEDVRVVFCVNSDDPDFDQCVDTYATRVGADGNFSRSGINSGSLRVAFRLDPNDNGSFEPDEPFAELQDPNGFLGNVGPRQSVTLADVIIDFNSRTATADISKGSATSPTPRPTATNAL